MPLKEIISLWLINVKFFNKIFLAKYRDEKLLNYELAKLKQFELEPEEYYTSLKKNINNE